MTIDRQKDSEIAARIAGGDKQAFQELFEALSNDVFRLCFSYLRNKEAAEDATQEAFVKLWQNIEKWKPEASIKTWLMTMTRNLCLDILRKRQSDMRKIQNLQQHNIVEQLDIQKDDAAYDVDYKNHDKIIKNALFELPERQREAIMLVYYNEEQNIDAAEIMDLEVPTFNSLLARARRSLKENLEKHGETLKGYFYDKQ